ncbi:hypothetical protein QFW96_05280 [Saccharopolyspora sp. TS4A08]|uniref:Uncharacterized protein n=1 Tax=Saccharopolyspora ipomoeae TaxID=3042027 RepID=A0ABT6PJ34_9PSEU|nr:hypothetical protein [Saccharopolyspora sp. TS4A08]MDI2028008.1 hypothetical protein [Saccharopolyspora sp. TS4A08]
MATTSSTHTQRGRKSSGPKQTRSSASGSSAQKTASAKKPDSTGASIPVPYVTASWHTTRIPLPEMPGRDNLASTVTAVRSNLPSPEQMLFYGGLTAAAALSVIEWPVAAAIGIGAAVMRRSSGQDADQD